MRQKKISQTPPDDLITPEEAARLLNITPATLQMRRHYNHPPRFYKLGPGKNSHVRYSRKDVLDYLKGCLRDTDGKEPQGGRR